jgi:hypothetical protein
MPKGIFLIVPALFIDFIQGAFSIMFAGFAGTIAGSAAAGAACSYLYFEGAVGYCVAGGAIVGTFANPALAPVGIVLGFVFNFLIALAFGSGLVLIMGLMGLLNGRHAWRVVPAYFGEVAPAFNNLPVWTGLVIWCVYKANKKDRVVAKEVRGRALGLGLDPEVQRVAEEQRKTSTRSVRDTFTAPARGVGREVIASLVLFLCIAGTVNAQGIDPIRFLIAPETPGPNEVVHIEAQGVGSFIGESNIVWSRNGTRELAGVGERTFTFTTGALGERATVRVVIESSSQGTIARDLVFVPSLVNLVWEADTYTPPLYSGKALYTGGSPLKVAAYPVVIINGVQVANGSLSYQWRRNDEVVANASGLGRNVFSFVGDQLQAGEEVGVDIYIGNSKVGHGRTTIPANEPLLLIYNRDPLRGVEYEQALPQSIALTGREITLQAEPYFVSNNSKNGGRISYEWLLNGEETSGPDSAQGVLTLRQEGGGSGTAYLGVAAQNENNSQFVQRAEAQMQISFGQTATQDPFSSALGAAVATFNRIAQTTERPQILITPAQRPWTGSVYSEIQQQSFFSQTQTTNVQADGSLGYQPLEPLSSFGNTQNGAWNLEYYLQTVFSLLIIIGALMAVLMLTLGGVTYMVSEAAVTKMQALERAKAAVYGLLIIGGAWLILSTINPDLLRFNLDLGQVKIVREAQNLPGNTGAQIEEKGFADAVWNWDERQKEDAAIRAAIGGCINLSGGCFFSDRLLIYDPNKITESSVTNAQKEYTQWCETGFGSGIVKRVPGSAIGASGKEVLVCSYL